MDSLPTGSPPTGSLPADSLHAELAATAAESMAQYPPYGFWLLFLALMIAALFICYGIVRIADGKRRQGRRDYAVLGYKGYLPRVSATEQEIMHDALIEHRAARQRPRRDLRVQAGHIISKHRISQN